MSGWSPQHPSLPADRLRPWAEELLVAATIACEVPPFALTSPHSQAQFTDEMIGPSLRAVAEVVRNRVRHARFPNSPLEVVLQLKAFSCTLRGVSLADVGHRDIWKDAVAGHWVPSHVERALGWWRDVWGHQGASALDQVPGALWYYSPVSMRPPRRVPSWAVDLTPVPLPGVHEDYFRFFKP